MAKARISNASVKVNGEMLKGVYDYETAFGITDGVIRLHCWAIHEEETDRISLEEELELSLTDWLAQTLVYRVKVVAIDRFTRVDEVPRVAYTMELLLDLDVEDTEDAS